MKARESLPRQGRRAGRWVKIQALTLSWLVMAAGTMAQQVFVPFPSVPPEQPQPAPETTDTDEVKSSTTAPAPTLMPSSRQPIQWGSIAFHPHLAYQFLYGNGILSQPGQSQKTAINQVAPGIGLDLGSHWKLDYTPTFLFYSDPSFRNTVNQFINLAGSTVYNDWALNLSQNCALTSDPQVQTAQQTDQQTYLTSFDATHRLNSETSLELSAKQNLMFVQDVLNSVGNSLDWSTLDWLDFQWGPNLGAGGGIGLGYNNVEFGTDMVYEQLQARITWRVAHKVNLSVSGGAEFRQFLASTQPQLISPLAGIILNYQPLEVTTISLNANQGVSASYFQDLVTDIASINASISQRFFKHFYLGLSGGYSQSTYKESGPVTAGDPNVGRKDHYTFLSVSLSTTFLKRGTASVFYSTSDNSSNRNGFSYSSDQIGFQLGYRY
jgi:hypothetical protein